MGGAGVAGQFGAESQVVNPAAIAFATAPEVTLLHGQSFEATRDLLATVIPSRRLGSFAASAYLANLYEDRATDELGNDVGGLYYRAVSAAGSYASTFGRDLAVGLTYRVAQFRVDCSGPCTQGGVPIENRRGTTSMVDLGAQYDFRRKVPLVVGAAVRYLGLRLQVKDSEQADPLPTQLAVGARYDVEALARRVKDVRLRVAADVVSSLSAGGATPAVHVGAEGMFRSVIALRGGWVQQRGTSGPSIGFGYAGRRLGFDVARQLTGFSVDAGEPPTFVALRYRF